MKDLKEINFGYEELKERFLILENNLEIEKRKNAKLKKRLKSYPTVTYSQVIFTIILIEFLSPLALIKAPFYYYTKGFWNKFANHHNISTDNVLNSKYLNATWKKWTWFSLVFAFIALKHIFPNHWAFIYKKFEKKYNILWNKYIGRFDRKVIDDIE